MEVDYSMVPMKPEKQFKRAIEVNAEYTVKLENEGNVLLKNLKTKQEEKIPIDKIRDRMLEAILGDDSE